MQIYNQPVEIAIGFDQETERMQVRDTYGEFIPFPYKMWWRCVELPYRKHFKQVGTTYQRVVEIFIGEYQHRYICNN